jgi:hypothetical protein
MRDTFVSSGTPPPRPPRRIFFLCLFSGFEMLENFVEGDLRLPGLFSLTDLLKL